MRGVVAKGLRRMAREAAPAPKIERELLEFERRTYGESEKPGTRFCINEPDTVRGVYRRLKKRMKKRMRQAA